MGVVFETQCKDCDELFFFTETSRENDIARGMSPPERCPECRKKNAAAIRSVGAAYWNAPLEADDTRRCWGALGLGRLVRHRAPPRRIEYSGIPTDLPLKSLADAKNDEERYVIQRFGTIAPAAADLVRALEDPNGPRVSILVGPTGTGKSTWIPYCLLQSKVGRTDRICVTQPRTITLRHENRDLEDDTTIPGFIAKKLLKAPDRGAGQDIGLRYREQTDQWDRYTRLLFATDGIIVPWLTSGEIANFSVLMIDEAHEQSENMEQIFALLRYKLPLYPKLRVVIASATIAARKFQEFFGRGDPDSVPVFAPPNAASHTNYRIHDRWPDEYAPLLADSEFQIPELASHCPKAAAKIVEAIRTLPGFTRLNLPYGDIVIFMPTITLVEKTVEVIDALDIDDLQTFPCHAQCSDRDMKRFLRSEIDVKQALKRGNRPTGQRVLVATTYAETSVTITNLSYVIDSGYTTSPQWRARTCSSGVTPNERHTQAGCNQRKGRVGRQQEGECFRLYREADFKNPSIFSENPSPAVARSRLDRFLLAAKACGIDDLSTYQWIGKSETPQDEIDRAQAALLERGAIDSDGDLTTVGLELQRIETDSIDLSVFMADSDTHACALEVAAFVGFVNWRKRIFERDECGLLGFQKWRSGCRDDLEFYLRVFHHWREIEGIEHRKQWCSENGLQDGALRSIAENLEQNLRQFSPRTHESLLDRALDIEHLHRTRLILARCMPNSAFVRSECEPNVFVPYGVAHSDQRIQLDQESACAGRADMDAFVCIDRQHDSRSNNLIARHIVCVSKEWLRVLPNATSIERARLLRRFSDSGNPKSRVDAHARICAAPLNVSRDDSRIQQDGQLRRVEIIRQGWSSGRSLILAIDQETQEPVLLSPRHRLRRFVPGTVMRGQVVNTDSSAAHLSQDAVCTEHLSNDGKEIDAVIVEVSKHPTKAEPSFAVIELEPGVEARLHPQNSDYSTWRTLDTSAVGNHVSVKVIKDRLPSPGISPNLVVQTTAFAVGSGRSLSAARIVKGIIHSSIWNRGSSSRVGFRIELAPGHLYRMFFDALPEDLSTASWEVGQSLDVAPDHVRKLAYPHSPPVKTTSPSGIDKGIMWVNLTGHDRFWRVYYNDVVLGRNELRGLCPPPSPSPKAPSILQLAFSPSGVTATRLSDAVPCTINGLILAETESMQLPLGESTLQLGQAILTARVEVSDDHVPVDVDSSGIGGRIAPDDATPGPLYLRLEQASGFPRIYYTTTHLGRNDFRGAAPKEAVRRLPTVVLRVECDHDAIRLIQLTDTIECSVGNEPMSINEPVCLLPGSTQLRLGDIEVTAVVQKTIYDVES